jgi:uncharacterized surface protein with fasciclin (FAS1) repeats
MKFRTLAASAITATAIAVTALVAPAGAAPAPTSGPTIADLLDAQGDGTDRNWKDYDILAAGVDAAGLSDALDDPEADLTVFIPNDRAFQALVADLFGWRYWFANEATILGKVVELETSAPGTLATVIAYHAVPGQISSSAALSVPRGTELTTLQGGEIEIFPVRIFGTAILADQDRNDLDPILLPGQLDIQASNGIAHGISLVLRPVNL